MDQRSREAWGDTLFWGATIGLVLLLAVIGLAGILWWAFSR